PVPVARRPRDHLRHRGPFPDEQEMQLVFQSPEAARRDVVLDGAVRFLRDHGSAPGLEGVPHPGGDGNPPALRIGFQAGLWPCERLSRVRSYWKRRQMRNSRCVICVTSMLAMLFASACAQDNMPQGPAGPTPLPGETTANAYILPGAVALGATAF